jgi:hypothetical protein
LKNTDIDIILYKFNQSRLVLNLEFTFFLKKGGSTPTVEPAWTNSFPPLLLASRRQGKLKKRKWERQLFLPALNRLACWSPAEKGKKASGGHASPSACLSH